MSTEPPTFREANRWETPIRDLGLRIDGTRLAPIIAAFQAELEKVGLHKLRTRFYLSTEWGVVMDTVSIALPFYLVDQELTEYHAERVGHIEGFTAHDILRYLRHEMGHVVNYAFKLYDRPDWVQRFGAISQPYLEDYRPQPFSRRYVRHLPGWYAQKHPDEDWAETFAVWMTPDSDWRREYSSWDEALDKLMYTDALMSELRDGEPLTNDDGLDEPVSELPYSVQQYYDEPTSTADDEPVGLEGSLRAVFADDSAEQRGEGARYPAARLILTLARELQASVFVWTGHFPERTRILVHQLAKQAEALRLDYDPTDERRVTVALTALVTALAMNHVHRGSYYP